MYEEFGAHDVGGRIRFRVFFPDASQYVRGGAPLIAELRVFGDFQSALGQTDWSEATALPLPAHLHPAGTLFEAVTPVLPPGFYQYKYIVRFADGTQRKVGDPCTRYGGGADENAGVVVGGSTPTDNLVPPLVQRDPLRDLVIYEVMLDDFTAEYRGSRAPFDAVTDKLDYLVNLGVSAIELMPWTAWPGEGFSWGYNPFLYFSVESHYVADPQQPVERLSRLKRLIRLCHERGLHVIMDGVFNHVDAGGAHRGFPYYWLYQDPQDCPFVGQFAGTGYFNDLDFTNPCTQQFILDVCKYWIDVFRIDGLRLDYTQGLYQSGTGAAGLTKLISDLRAYLTARGEQNFSITIEHLNGYDAIDVMNRVDASSCWYDEFYQLPQRALPSGRLETGLLRMLNVNQNVAPGRVPTTYIENHDHAQIASAAGGRQRWYRTQPWAIALLTSPGAVLLHNGQEFADDYWFPEPGCETPNQPRVAPRPVDWTHHANDHIGATLRDFYRRLIALRRAHPALRSPNFYPASWEGWQELPNPAGYGVHVNKRILIYHRWDTAAGGLSDRYIIALNFSGDTQTIDIPFSLNGVWEDLLSGWRVSITDLWLRGQSIGSNWGHVFFKRG